MTEKKDLHWYADWVPVKYEDEEEMEMAKKYLTLWKYFILRKLNDMEFVEETWIERPHCWQENMKGLKSIGIATLALKICLKGKNEFLKGCMEPREIGK